MGRRKKEEPFDPQKILSQIQELKGVKKLDDDVVYGALEFAIAKAVAKQFELEVDPEVSIDRETGIMTFLKAEIEEVEEEIYDEELEEMVVRIVENRYVLEDEPLEIDLRKLGRLAMQIARQVMIQKLREAEWEIIFEEYYKQKKQLVTAEIMNVDEWGNLHLKLDRGRTEAVMPRKELIPTEQYMREGEGGKPILAIILDVKKEGKRKDSRKSSSRVRIILSRANKEFVHRLFEREVPEIKNKVVSIKAIARIAGIRTKLAVQSNDLKVDGVGACVGTKGNRINKITAELNNEKIDVIHYSDDIETMIFNALKPAKVSTITLDYDRNRAMVVVPDDELKLAIGKKGINVKLASELTNWHLDIITSSQEGELEHRTIAKLLTVEGVDYALAKELFDVGLNEFDEILEETLDNLAEMIGGFSPEDAKKLQNAILDLSEEDYYAKVTPEQIEEVKKSQTQSLNTDDSESAKDVEGAEIEKTVEDVQPATDETSAPAEDEASTKPEETETVESDVADVAETVKETDTVEPAKEPDTVEPAEKVDSDDEVEAEKPAEKPKKKKPAKKATKKAPAKTASKKSKKVDA
ncbi:MAG: transcription termination factor NusA, partial [Candidatus Heimdallarchaeota archaeon]|nr:transcription termination factor NusA [Candidatus Heimdallarchaeota archaeon]